MAAAFGMSTRDQVLLLVDIQRESLAELELEYRRFFPEEKSFQLVANFVKWLALLRGIYMDYTAEQAEIDFPNIVRG